MDIVRVVTEKNGIYGSSIHDPAAVSALTGAELCFPPTDGVATTMVSPCVCPTGVGCSTLCTCSWTGVCSFVAGVGVGGGGAMTFFDGLDISQNRLGTFFAGGIPKNPLPPILSSGLARPPT